MAAANFKPFKIHAYEVVPQRLQAAESKPRGGAFTANAKFKAVLDSYLEKSKLAKQPEVGFNFIDKTKNGKKAHSVRNWIMDYCFEGSSKSKKASLELAKRLGRSMDKRSPFTLLMLIAYKDKNTANLRRLVMWAFPKDEPFKFSAGQGTAQIEIPTDTFSRSSSIKKGAMFEGVNSDASFLQGYVMDRQAQNSSNEAAAYWVNEFLDSQFSLNGINGTRLLAKTLRATYNNLTDQAGKNEVSDSITAAFTSRTKKRSLKSHSDLYFSKEIQKVFRAQSPPESFDTKFDFIKSEFEEKVQLRVFRLNDEVVVSAPFSAIDTNNGSVKTTTSKKKKTIRVTGTIVEETVKPGKKKKAKKKAKAKKKKASSVKKKASA